MSVSSGTLAITLISLNSSFANIKAKLKSFDSSQSMLPHVLFNARGVTAWQNGDKFARRLKERPREGRESLAKWEDFISCVLFLKLILGNCLAACTNTYIHNTWKATNLPMRPPPPRSRAPCARYAIVRNADELLRCVGGDWKWRGEKEQEDWHWGVNCWQLRNVYTRSSSRVKG